MAPSWIKSSALGLTRLARAAMDFCYPGCCAACGARCDGAAPLCGQCLLKLRRLEAAPACAACARPLAEEVLTCPYCQGRGLGPLQRIAALGLFEEPLRTLIHQLKYRSRWPLAEQLADRLLEKPAMQTMMRQCDVLVSVPLHRLRQISRGYNQSEVIARRLGRQCGLRLLHPAVRLKRTRTQTHIHALSVRRDNLRDAFVLVRPEQVHGQRVVIVDDVMTSAATVLALARTLRQAKPASLGACVLAVADPRGRGFEYI